MYHIFVDLDGVVFDTMGLLCQKLHQPIEKVTQWQCWDQLGISKQEFYNLIEGLDMTEATIYEDVPEALRMLSWPRDHYVCYLTSMSPRRADSAIYALRSLGLEYPLYQVERPQDKLNVIAKHENSFLFDDYPYFPYKDSLRLFCVARPWNMGKLSFLGNVDLMELRKFDIMIERCEDEPRRI